MNAVQVEFRKPVASREPVSQRHQIESRPRGVGGLLSEGEDDFLQWMAVVGGAVGLEVLAHRPAEIEDVGSGALRRRGDPLEDVAKLRRQ